MRPRWHGGARRGGCARGRETNRRKTRLMRLLRRKNSFLRFVSWAGGVARPSLRSGRGNHPTASPIPWSYLSRRAAPGVEGQLPARLLVHGGNRRRRLPAPAHVPQPDADVAPRSLAAANVAAVILPVLVDGIDDEAVGAAGQFQ